jgi:hypothetical protein
MRKQGERKRLRHSWLITKRSGEDPKRSVSHKVCSLRPMPSSLACGTSGRCRPFGRHDPQGPASARPSRGMSGTALPSRRRDEESSVRPFHRPADHRLAGGRKCRCRPAGRRGPPGPVSAHPVRDTSDTVLPCLRWGGEWLGRLRQAVLLWETRRPRSAQSWERRSALRSVGPRLQSVEPRLQSVGQASRSAEQRSPSAGRT